MTGLQHPDPNYRASTYRIARTVTRCWHCGQSTRVLALLLPEDHEALDPETRDESKAWQPAGGSAFVFFLAYLPDDVQRRLSQLSSTNRLADNEPTPTRYWANHCDHCGSLLDDRELHCERDAFMPRSEAAARNIALLHVNESLEVLAAGYAFEPEFLRFMRKA